jgi:hypothetical protein
MALGMAQKTWADWKESEGKMIKECIDAHV